MLSRFKSEYPDQFMTIDEIKQQLFDLYPIGSRWYDCLQDDIGIVKYHFNPRGIILKMEGGDYHRYGFGELLQGILKSPQDGGGNMFNAFREECKKINDEYDALMDGKTVWIGPSGS